MDLKLFFRAFWDRISAGLLVLTGALALVLGWFGVSGTPLPSEQIPYVVSGGLVGIALIGLGSTLWLSADLRDEWRKLETLEQTLREVAAPRAPSNTPASDNGDSVAGQSTRSRRSPRQEPRQPSASE